MTLPRSIPELMAFARLLAVAISLATLWSPITFAASASVAANEAFDDGVVSMKALGVIPFCLTLNLDSKPEPYVAMPCTPRETAFLSKMVSDEPMTVERLQSVLAMAKFCPAGADIFLSALAEWIRTTATSLADSEQRQLENAIEDAIGHFFKPRDFIKAFWGRLGPLLNAQPGTLRLTGSLAQLMMKCYDPGDLDWVVKTHQTRLFSSSEIIWASLFTLDGVGAEFSKAEEAIRPSLATDFGIEEAFAVAQIWCVFTHLDEAARAAIYERNRVLLEKGFKHELERALFESATGGKSLSGAMERRHGNCKAFLLVFNALTFGSVADIEKVKAFDFLHKMLTDVTFVSENVLQDVVKEAGASHSEADVDKEVIPLRIAKTLLVNVLSRPALQDYWRSWDFSDFPKVNELVKLALHPESFWASHRLHDVLFDTSNVLYPEARTFLSTMLHLRAELVNGLTTRMKSTFLDAIAASAADLTHGPLSYANDTVVPFLVVVFHVLCEAPDHKLLNSFIARFPTFLEHLIDQGYLFLHLTELADSGVFEHLVETHYNSPSDKDLSKDILTCAEANDAADAAVSRLSSRIPKLMRNNAD